MELCCFKLWVVVIIKLLFGNSGRRICLFISLGLFAWIRIIIIIVEWNDLWGSLRPRRIANRIVVTMDKDRKIDLNRILLWSICNYSASEIVHELQGKRLLVNIYGKW